MHLRKSCILFFVNSNKMHKSVALLKPPDCRAKTTNEKDSVTKLVSRNVHTGLHFPLENYDRSSMIEGDYIYFHYGCEGQDDRGWGCGYRSVQTMASWLLHNCHLSRGQQLTAPSLPDMQRALVTMGDKPCHFSGSREWIGTFEASLILDYFYDVPCKVVHFRGGAAELERAVEQLHEHFERQRSPVMMGGDRDNSSKCVLGVCTGGEGSYLLIVDPHYYGPVLEKGELQRRGWVSWRRVSCLDQSSFYNLCMPQTGRIIRIII